MKTFNNAAFESFFNQGPWLDVFVRYLDFNRFFLSQCHLVFLKLTRLKGQDFTCYVCKQALQAESRKPKPMYTWWLCSIELSSSTANPAVAESATPRTSPVPTVKSLKSTSLVSYHVFYKRFELLWKFHLGSNLAWWEKTWPELFWAIMDLARRRVWSSHHIFFWKWLIFSTFASWAVHYFRYSWSLFLVNLTKTRVRGWLTNTQWLFDYSFAVQELSTARILSPVQSVQCELFCTFCTIL